VYVDKRFNVSPGFKFHHWEMKGDPIRVEIGPRELQTRKLVVVERLSGKKHEIECSFSSTDGTGTKIKALLDTMHHKLFLQAKDKINASIKTVSNIEECFDKSAKKIFAARFCESIECEADFKKRGLGKPLCIPFNQISLEHGNSNLCSTPESDKIQFAYQNHHPLDISTVLGALSNQTCFACTRQAKRWTLFGKSY